MPGSARSTAQAWVLGAAPKRVDAPLKILLAVESWAFAVAWICDWSRATFQIRTSSRRPLKNPPATLAEVSALPSEALRGALAAVALEGLVHADLLLGDGEDSPRGLGFAGALAEVGLPQNAIPLALLLGTPVLTADEIEDAPALAARLLGVGVEGLLAGRGAGPGGPPTGTLLGALFESLATLSVRVFAQAAEATVSHLRTRGGEREVEHRRLVDDQHVDPSIAQGTLQPRGELRGQGVAKCVS